MVENKIGDGLKQKLFFILIKKKTIEGLYELIGGLLHGHSCKQVMWSRTKLVLASQEIPHNDTANISVILLKTFIHLEFYIHPVHFGLTGSHTCKFFLLSEGITDDRLSCLYPMTITPKFFMCLTGHHTQFC